MQASPTRIAEIQIVSPEVLSDQRGFFFESYCKSDFESLGIGDEFVQDNQSGSSGGVLRGLHYQIKHPQGKLVRVVAGEIFDVAVDLRQGSPTFGDWIGVRLSAANRRMLWIPAGFAHGFYTISEWAEVVYKVTDYYTPEWERTLRWNDPQVNIDWPLMKGRDPILSKKDADGALLEDAETYPQL